MRRKSHGLRRVEGVKGAVTLFRNNYVEFWELMEDSSDTDELFNGGHKEEEANTCRGKGPRAANSSFNLPLFDLFDSLSNLVGIVSMMRVQKIGVAATVAGLQLATSRVHVAKVKADTRYLKQRQPDSAEKRKRPNVSMIKTFQEALAHTLSTRKSE